jgi:Na+/phosphate symporter
VQYFSGSAPISRQIANAHLLFNVAGVVLFIGFTPLLVRSLVWLIPDRSKKINLHLLSSQVWDKAPQAVFGDLSHVLFKLIH